MILNKLIQTILLGCTIFTIFICLFAGIDQSQSFAVSLTASVNLQSGVDSFLTSIPSGYYTIASVKDLKNQLGKPQTMLVDVREPSEYQSGHIPNAINIPLRTLAHNLNQIPHNHPVVLYCSSGYRSAMGVMTLHLLGYENVQGFPPSFVAWQAAGEAMTYGRSKTIASR